MKNAKPWISRRLNFNLPAPTNVDPDQEWLDPEVIPGLQKDPVPSGGAPNRRLRG